MDNSRSLDQIVLDIKQLAEQDNLACVLIHLNDTYFIDERKPNIPGMPRVAGLVQQIRELVVNLVGEDRTLLLHSGDYLSPSAMSNQFQGAQMTQLLATCGVNFATIGNHEFDFTPAILWSRLREMGACTHLLANLDPPTRQEFTKLAFWPPTKPFLAIAGLVGEQTIKKAIDPKFGFTVRDLQLAATEIVNSVRSTPGIGSLIVLSHMDRKEDKELQALLSDLWGEHGFLYLLGGHDHDIKHREQDRRYCYLSKCLSNCKSITLFLLPKDGIAAPFIRDMSSLRHPTHQETRGRLLTMHLDDTRDLRELFERQSDSAPEELAEPDDQYPDSPLTDSELLDSVLQEYRRIAGPNLRDDFRESFERQIRSCFYDKGRASRNEALSYGTLAYDVVSWACSYAMAAFPETAREISSVAHLNALPEHALAMRQVEERKQEMINAAFQDREVVDFTSEISPLGTGMDARDSPLRCKSTDFGNFAADAIKAATQADLALINSGAFRIDGFVSPKLTRNILRDVFIYGAPRSITVVEMEIDEILKFYDHSLGKAGHGAFLQVSEPREAVEVRRGRVRVALVTHMLAYDEDKYQSILARSRNVDGDALLGATGAIVRPESMVELIELGVEKGVSYSREIRGEVKSVLGGIDIQTQEFLRLVDHYRTACTDAGIIPRDQLSILNGNTREIPQERLEKWAFEKRDCVALATGNLLRFVEQEIQKSRSFMTTFPEHLVHSPQLFASGIRYQDYFYAAIYRYN